MSDVFTAMGVLLALQAMDRTRLELLGDTYQDDTLEMGMAFLRAASSKSNLAARYVDLLQRIRKRPNDQYSTHTAPRDNIITIQDESVLIPRSQHFLREICGLIEARMSSKAASILTSWTSTTCSMAPVSLETCSGRTGQVLRHDTALVSLLLQSRN